MRSDLAACRQYGVRNRRPIRTSTPSKYPIRFVASTQLPRRTSRPQQCRADRKARGAMVTGAVVRPAAEAWGRRARRRWRPGSGGAGVDAELGEDAGDMILNRAHTDEEGRGDGRVGLPRGEQTQDFTSHAGSTTCRGCWREARTGRAPRRSPASGLRVRPAAQAVANASSPRAARVAATACSSATWSSLTR